MRAIKLSVPERMILRDLFESGLIKDEDKIILNCTIGRKRMCGNWYEDGILKSAGMYVESMRYDSMHPTGKCWQIQLAGENFSDFLAWRKDFAAFREAARKNV